MSSHKIDDIIKYLHKYQLENNIVKSCVVNTLLLKFISKKLYDIDLNIESIIIQYAFQINPMEIQPITINHLICSYKEDSNKKIFEPSIDNIIRAKTKIKHFFTFKEFCKFANDSGVVLTEKNKNILKQRHKHFIKESNRYNNNPEYIILEDLDLYMTFHNQLDKFVEYNKSILEIEKLYELLTIHNLVKYGMLID